MDDPQVERHEGPVLSDAPTPGEGEDLGPAEGGAGASLPAPPMGYSSGGGGYREVTLSAILFALIVGAVMNASITYAGLKIGFTIGGSAIAAVLGFGILRGILRRGTILETNIAQTAASAINIPNSGIIFTVPVLFLLGYSLSWNEADFWLITLACIAGALLGCAFIIPLRKQMIDIDRLRFPTGMGVAAILKSPGAGPKKAIVLVLGILLGAAIYLPVGLPQLQTELPLGHIPQDDQRSMQALILAESQGETFTGLDHLVYLEQITEQDAQLTRDLARWVRDESAPQEVIDLGEAAEQLARQRVQLNEKLSEVDPENPSETLRAEITSLRDTIKSGEERLATLDEATDYGVREARAVYLASTGEQPWESLVDKDIGWAAKGLWGYSDLELRLPAAYEKQSTDLQVRVDRDQNGRPDHVIDNEHVDLGRFLNLPDQFELVFAIAPFALGAGFITGKAGLLVLAGGILAYFVLTPVAYSAGWMPSSVTAADAPGYGFGAFNRPLGIGLLLGGALMGVLASLPAIGAALKSVAAAGKGRGGGPGGGKQELGIGVLVVATLLAVVLLFFAGSHVGNKPLNSLDPVTQTPVDVPAATIQHEGYNIEFATAESLATFENEWTEQQRLEYITETEGVKPGILSNATPNVRAAIIAVIGAAWIWFAGIIIAQCTGMTDWSPISGMALLTVVLVLLLAGSGAVVGAVLIGAALCVAITLAADMMQDLRTGHLVGARPRSQQLTEMCCVAIGPVVCMMTLLLITQVNEKAYGVALGPGTPTAAPQAQALQAVITGVQGGEMPYMLYGLGAILGGLLGLGAFSGLGVLVGLSMYLPFQYIATYGIGCVVNMLLAGIKGRTWTEEWGVPFAAGLIVGESVLALVINGIILVQG